jgi:Protein of unknown function (DUF4012)
VPSLRSTDARRRLAHGVAFVALAATLLSLASFTMDVAGAVALLERGVTRLDQASASLSGPLDVTPADRVAAAGTLQREAAADIASATARLRADLALRAAARLPIAAAQRAAALDLADSAGDAAAAVGDLVRVGRAAADLPGGAAPPGPRLLALLVAAAPALRDAGHRLDLGLARLGRDAGLLPPLQRQVAAAMDRLGRARERVVTASAAADSLPAVLGAAGPRTYLLLFPNPYELRPSGGLFGSLATVTMDHGTASGIAVLGYEAINALQRERVPVPAALARRMSFAGDSLDLGDAGWDPDFPTSAALCERIYRSATGRQVDGTIAIDPYAISALLTVTGPLDVPPYGAFTAADFFPKLNAIVNTERGPGSGKQAMVPVSRALVTRLMGAPPSLWLRMLGALAPEARTGHVQLAMHDAAASAAARGAHVDGALVQPPAGEDYEMVVDANVGGTKGDAIVRKSVEDRVEIGDDGLARHLLALRYAYPPGAVDDSVPPGADPAYRDYVRVYLPEASTITGFAELDGAQPAAGAIEDLTVEHGKRVVGTFFRTAPGHTTELRLWYEAPLAPGPAYRLYVQKQAGVLGRPTRLVAGVPGAVRTRALAGGGDEEVTISW